MTPHDALTLAEKIPSDTNYIVVVVGVVLCVIFMLILMIGRQYRRIALGRPGVQEREPRDEDTIDAWSESARRVHVHLTKEDHDDLGHDSDDDDDDFGGSGGFSDEDETY